MKFGTVRSSDLGDNWSAQHHLAEPEPDPKGNPLAVGCPACGSPAFVRCTAPTVDGRRPVAWVHNARRDLADGWT